MTAGRCRFYSIARNLTSKLESLSPFTELLDQAGRDCGSSQNVNAHHRHSIITAIGLIFGLACTPVCHAACIPKNLATSAPQDPVARVLSAQNACPRTPHEF